jgi:hypothetical protein
VGFIKRLYEGCKFRIKLWEMDDRWRYEGRNSYELFPPSFYMTHTPEEAKRITEESLNKLKKMLEDYKNEYIK